MAYGDGEVDTTLRESWHAFCERVKEAGDLIFEDAVPTDSQERALGFQYLTRMLGHGLERMIEHTDVLHPNLWRYMSPTNKWGGDNPDALYLVAPLDGSRTYRIVGRRGTAHYHVFSTQRRWEDVAEGESAEVARMRWIMADSAPLPRTRLVKLADLDTVVPPNARRINAEGRREQLRRRKIGIDRRFRA